jgi:coenzyme F420-dependent glucose-6-phosphate dehydrogenase
MAEFGYALSSEEHSPNDLIRNARRAEEIGFSFAMISDHYHPWLDQQGHSPFVWNIIGGIAATTERIRLGTGVTAPIMRINPAILAQAAATSAAMMPGRFIFGVGTGEALNEHILGEHWPITSVRQDMLTEAIDIIRLLWEGEEVSYWGEFYTIENARLYTLPDEPPPIYVAASGPESASLAGEIGDGFITTKANKKLLDEFEEGGGKGKSKVGQVKVCWAESEEEALNIVHKYWPTALVPGSLHADLPTPAHFEEAASMIKKEDLKEAVVMGPNPDKHMEKIQEMVDMNFDMVYIHQIGPDQEGFFNFYQREILPAIKAQAD